MSGDSIDDNELEVSSSISDLECYLDGTDSLELSQRLIQILPTFSELKLEIFSPDEMRSSSGKQEIISDHMYSLHLTYLNWKKSRKANAQIPEQIRLSVEKLKPNFMENRKVYRNFEYQLKAS